MEVWDGLTLTYRTPAFHALCSSIWQRVSHLCSDIFLGNLLDLSIPDTFRSSVARRSWVFTNWWARRKSGWMARSFSVRHTLA